MCLCGECVCGEVCMVCVSGWVVVGVCGSDDSKHAVSVQGHADYAPNWVAEHLGASSRRPRHPFPALMAGEPWPCTCVHGPKKTHRPSRHLLLNNNRHAKHNRDIDHHVNILQIRREAATVGSRLSSHRPHLWNLQACTPRPSVNGLQL